MTKIANTGPNLLETLRSLEVAFGTFPRWWRHPTMADLMESHGRHGVGRPLPEKYSAMPLGQCFQNACELGDMHHELTYVEGFASVDGALVAHAWCVDDQGDIVDSTWASLERDLSTTVYSGIPYARSFIDLYQAETGLHGTLSNSWQLDFRDFRHGYAYDDAGCANGWAPSWTGETAS